MLVIQVPLAVALRLPAKDEDEDALSLLRQVQLRLAAASLSREGIHSRPDGSLISKIKDTLLTLPKT